MHPGGRFTHPLMPHRNDVRPYPTTVSVPSAALKTHFQTTSNRRQLSYCSAFANMDTVHNYRQIGICNVDSFYDSDTANWGEIILLYVNHC